MFGPRCGAGDRMGCGIKFEQISPENDPSSVPVFFTKNGKEVCSILLLFDLPDVLLTFKSILERLQ